MQGDRLLHSQHVCTHGHTDWTLTVSRERAYVRVGRIQYSTLPHSLASKCAHWACSYPPVQTPKRIRKSGAEWANGVRHRDRKEMTQPPKATRLLPKRLQRALAQGPATNRQQHRNQLADLRIDTDTFTLYHGVVICSESKDLPLTSARFALSSLVVQVILLNQRRNRSLFSFIKPSTCIVILICTCNYISSSLNS